MVRVLIGTGIGVFVGLMALATCGAVYGAQNGLPSAGLPPGADAAARQALFFTVFFSWFAAPVGGLLGGVGGLIWWAARPPASRAGAGR